MTRESQLVDEDATLIQQRRDSGPLRGRKLEVRTCVLDKGDTAFRFRTQPVADLWTRPLSLRLTLLPKRHMQPALKILLDLLMPSRR